MHTLTIGQLRDTATRAAGEVHSGPLRAELEAIAVLARAVIGASHVGTAADTAILEAPTAETAADPRARLTLAEWQAKYSGFVIHQHATGAYWLPDYLMPDGPRWDLFHLRDYVVSSITGGSIWLVWRGETR